MFCSRTLTLRDLRLAKYIVLNYNQLISIHQVNKTSVCYWCSQISYDFNRLAYFIAWCRL